MEPPPDPERVDRGLERLAQLLLRTDKVPETVLHRARRLIRPTSRDVAQGIHTNAVKLRMRRTLMNSVSSESSSGKSMSGPSKVADFDKDIDLLRRRHVKHWQSFLAVLEPLSCSASVANRLHMEQKPPAFSLLSQHAPADSGGATVTLPAQTFRSDSLLPYGPPPILSDEVIQNINNDLVWIPRATELLLIRELLLVFQGINSPHIRLDDRTQAYVLHPELALPPPARDMVLCLCEVGWLYIKVKAYIDRVEDNQGRGGLIAQAFAFSLQNALNDYYRLLAVLEQELTRSSAVPTPSGGPASNHTVNEGTSGLTLLRLRAWMLEPLDRMCLMARITDCALPLAGGGLISRLNGHSYHGDERLRGFVVTLMKSVCVPLYHMISRWVLHGELLDPQLEFFVAKSTASEGGRGGSARSQFSISADFLWHHYYKLNLPMLPSFISPKLASKILVVGKSINFMKACMQHGGRDEQVRGGGVDAKRAASAKARAARVKAAPRPVVVARGMSLEGSDEREGGEGLQEEGARGVVSEVAATEEKSQKGGAEVEEEEVEGEVEDVVQVRGGAVQQMSQEEQGEENEEEEEEEDLSDSSILLSEDFEASLRSECRSYGDEAALSAQVHSIAAVIETRLLRMVLRKFNLFTHLSAMKKFMLLGQGDFVTCLMDTVGGELKRRANQLFRHNLTGLLDGALRSCNAQFEPAYVLERLGVRLLEASPGDSGWEVFSLDYAIDPPLAAVVHAEAVSKYRIAFHMLWRLKRVEWALSGAWRNLFTFHHTRGHFYLSKLKPILHRCAVERGKMTHFINSLNNFLMFEVVETAWVKLVAGIEHASCLDDIISCHDSYLQEIQERALLSEEHEGLNMQIQLVLQAILRFCNLEETMVGDALSVAARKRHEGQVGWVGPARSTEEGVNNTQLTVTSNAAPGTVDGVPGYIIARLEEAAQDYEKQFEKMLLVLQQQGETCGHLTRFLAFRLDLDLDLEGQPGQRRSSSGASSSWGGAGSEEAKHSHAHAQGQLQALPSASAGAVMNIHPVPRTPPLKSSIQQR